MEEQNQKINVALHCNIKMCVTILTHLKLSFLYRQLRIDPWTKFNRNTLAQ